MNRPYGFTGTIFPKSVCENTNENFTVDNIQISIKDCVFEVGYDDINDEDKARLVPQLFINSWMLRNNVKLKVDFNASWKMNAQGGKDIKIHLSDAGKVRAVLHSPTVITTVKKKNMTYVVKNRGSNYDFSHDKKTVEKALKDSTLQKALLFFANEVVEDDRPLYGIYKALEVITDHLPGDGRRELARLVDQKKDYVSDIMETANYHRHSKPQGRNKLSESECRERARKLIEAYANSL